MDAQVLATKNGKLYFTLINYHKAKGLVITAIPNVVEFRHSSWWCEQVYTQLKKNKISFCGHSYPGLPDDFIITTTTAYYQLHGVPDLCYSVYSNGTLKRIADIGLNKKSAKQVYCFFNNTASVGAIKNALWLNNTWEIIYHCNSRK